VACCDVRATTTISGRPTSSSRRRGSSNAITILCSSYKVILHLTREEGAAKLG